MKRLVLFVEGEGESAALPRLVSKVVTRADAWDTLILDPDPFRIGAVPKLLKNDCRDWKRWLQASLKTRSNTAAILLVLDGDLTTVAGDAFCASAVAKSLANEAKAVGAGVSFSVAVVFALKEYESWLIAGFESLAGRVLADGRRVDDKVSLPDGDLEVSPRDAKGWLKNAVEGGYKPTRDQALLTDALDIDILRRKEIRSFRRFETAVTQLIEAIRSGDHVATP